MKAGIFVIASGIGTMENKFNWEMAREMIESGLIDIQSHTWDGHYPVPDTSGRTAYAINTKLEHENKAAYRARILNDLKKSKTIIKKETGQEPVAFSYPGGQANVDLRKSVEAAGFSLAFEGANDESIWVHHVSPYSLKRFHIGRNTDVDQWIKHLKNDRVN